ncbi:MAG: TatD family hydrolase [Lachnospiraceae bacterium]|nr:TatD family hydrolase [Lachnospiraceae bacterium]
MIFDTHTHYNDNAFDADRDKIIKALPVSGITRVCNIGASLKSSEESMKLSEKYDFMWFTTGIHPDECGKYTGHEEYEDPEMQKYPGNKVTLPEAIMELRKMASHEKCVAIGEIGLDYHGFEFYEDKPGKEVQAEWFKAQLQLAAELNLPVVIHSRSACDDTLSIMKWAHDELQIKKAIIHCFSYSKETAMQYIEMGYYLGFGGSSTYEGQKKLTKVLSVTPLDRILLETDCPYLAPVPLRGERNDSRNLTFVRDKLAEIKGVDATEIEKAAYENGCRVYGL